MQNVIDNFKDINPKTFDLEPVKIERHFNMNFKWLFDLLGKALIPFMNLITPSIKDELTTFLQNTYQKAKATPNVWDDFFIKLLCQVLNVPLE